MRILIVIALINRLAARSSSPALLLLMGVLMRVRDALWRLMPLPLIAQALLALVLWLSMRGLVVTRLSTLVAVLVALTGLIPAVLRRDRLTGVVGGIALLLAAAALVPANPILPIAGGRTLTELPGGVVLRLFSVTLLGPLLLYFTTLFPVPRPLPRGLLVTVSLPGALFLSAGLLLPHEQLAWLGWCAVGWSAALIGWTLVRLGRAARGAAAVRLVLAVTLVAVAPLLARPLAAWFGWPLPPYELALGALLALPIGISYATLRHDLFGVDAQLRRALVYALLSLGVVAIYLAVTAGLTLLLSRTAPPLRGLATLTGLLVAAALFAPLRSRVQRLVDGLCYPERLEFQPGVADARRTLAQVTDRAAISAVIERQLPAAMGARWGALADTAPAQPDLVRAWYAPLTIGGQPLGAIWLGPRRSGLAYDAAERAELAALAQQVALALAYADTIAELRTLNRGLEAEVAVRSAQLVAQRAALIAADERQRLARDLHDSVTQTLFSLSLSTRATRQLLSHQPQAAAAALAEQEQTARRALAELRDLLTALRTAPSADQAGSSVQVADVLSEQIALVSARDGIAITLDCAEPIALPAARATAVGLIVREALHNAAKHSGAAAAHVTAAVSNADPQAAQHGINPRSAADHSAMLILVVHDAGCGFDSTAAHASYGLRGMAERAAALGATLRIASVPGGGTTVRLVLDRADTGLETAPDEQWGAL